MIYKQLIPSGTTRFHIFFQHAHDTRCTCRRTCACCMLTKHAKTYTVMSVGSRRQHVPVTAAAVELIMSSCGGLTMAASTTRDEAWKCDAWHAPTCSICTTTATATKFGPLVTTTDRLGPSIKMYHHNLPACEGWAEGTCEHACVMRARAHRRQHAHLLQPPRC